MLQRIYASMALASGMAAAADLPQCPERPIRFAFYEMGALYTQGVGIDKDLVDALQKRSGCAFAASVQLRARTWLELERGGVDMTGSALQTPGRDTSAWFLPYYADKNSLLMRKELPPGLQSLDALLADTRWRVGVVRGFVHGTVLDTYLARLRSQGRVDEVEDQDILYRMLAARRFDAIFGYSYVYTAKLKQHGIGDKVRVVRLDALPSTEVHVALSKKTFTPEQNQRWGTLLAGMRSDGTLRAIFQKHVGAEAARDMLQPRSPAAAH